MRILALFALVFVVYSLARILNEWQYRSATHKTLWFVILTAISYGAVRALKRSISG
jgi:hypothetical protein